MAEKLGQQFVQKQSTVHFATGEHFVQSINIENREEILIANICIYDEWFSQLVKMKSFEVIEKIEHLLSDIDVCTIEEKTFKILLKLIEHWYEINGERESLTDFNYKIKITGKNFIEIVEEYNDDEYIHESDEETAESSVNDMDKNLGDQDIMFVKDGENLSNDKEENECIFNLDNYERFATNPNEKYLSDLTLSCEDNQLKAHKTNLESLAIVENVSDQENKEIIDNLKYNFKQESEIDLYFSEIKASSNKDEEKGTEDIDEISDNKCTIQYTNEKNIFPCEDCEKIFNRGIDLKSHMTSVHVLSSDKQNYESFLEIEEYICQICGLNFESSEQLNSHSNDMFEDEKYFICPRDLCYFQTDIYQNLQHHDETLHTEDDFLDNAYDLIIEPQIIALLKANEVFVEQFPENNTCEIEYDDPLIEMMNTINNCDNKYTEKQNNFVFSLKQEIDEKLKKDGEDINDSDEYCKNGDILHQKEDHVCEEDNCPDLISIEDIKYSCEKCAFIVRNKNTLAEHIINVHGISKLSCDPCNLKFESTDVLKLHVKAVHEETNITCDQCNLVFHSRDDLVDHFKNTHDETKSNENFVKGKAKQISKKRNKYKNKYENKKRKILNYKRMNKRQKPLRKEKDWKKRKKKKKKSFQGNMSHMTFLIPVLCI